MFACVYAFERGKSRSKLAKELNQEQETQEELKHKQRRLEQDEDRIKRQIRVWKDLQVQKDLRVMIV